MPRPSSRPANGRRRPDRARRAFALDSLESRPMLSGLGAARGVGVAIAPLLTSTGTVTALTNQSPYFSNTMMLETDGTVLMQGGGTNKDWYRLTPDSTGSYANGTWSKVASMSLARLYFGSNVLPDGRVFVQGGEYSGPFGTSNDTNSGEIYNPVTNSWSTIATFHQSIFGDDPSEVLPNGNILAGYIVGPQTYIYNPTANTWTTAGTKLRSDQSDEEAWVKLPDNSILSYDVFSSISTGVGHAQRYVPSSNTWVDAGTVPVQLSSVATGYELGPGFLLPDGRAFYLGANGNTAYYTPSTNSWTAGPVIPSGLGADDAPGAMMPNGHILFTADTPLFNAPAHLFDYDPVAQTYTELTSLLPTNYLNGPSFVDRMLVLPTGQILINNDGSQLEIYTPGLAPLAASVPTISSIAANGDGSYKLTGTGLNGLSEGAAYGDDAEMSSNYPIVRLADSSNHVYYARTFGWTSLVATGSTPETTNFALPVGLPAGTYSLTVSGTGSTSASVPFTTPTNSTDPAPTIAVSASATPNPDPGTTAALSVLGADTLGESTLTYTWATTVSPSGTAQPSFSINATNAAKNTTVTFSHYGSYTFQVTATNLAGLSATSTVSINVTQTLTSVAVSPPLVNVAPGATKQLSASALDQFGTALASQPGFTYAKSSGGGSITASGLFTAPATGTLATVTATAGGVSGSASVFVLTAPLAQQDIGGPNIAGASGDDGQGHYTLVASGSDIYGGSDQFQFAYTTLTGDGTLIARVVTEQNTNTYAKAGVMFRDGLAAGSLEAFMALTPGAGTTFEDRTAVNGGTSTTGTPGSAPYWVRLVRSGNLFSGYYSPDGVTWTPSGSATIAMNTTVDVGLALTSHDGGTLNTTTFDHVNLASKPTIAAAASATPNPDPGTTAALSVLGADMAGEPNLTYTWAATSFPVGAPAPTFSSNGTNAAKNDTVTFGQAGNYTLTATITDSAGLSTTSSVVVTVNQTLSAVAIAPTSVTIAQGATNQFTATASDQFGQPLATQPTFTFSVVAGGAGGTVSATGLYTAPTNTFGIDQVKATAGAFSASATVIVTQVQASVGTTSVGWGSAGAATLQTASDGLRLLPAGRSTDLPWLNINQVTITLSKAGTLSPSDVTVSGVNVANYGPVTISGSGTTFTITLGQPISAADRVTVTIANAGIATFTRRLDVLPGDVNDDGAVNSMDMVFIRNQIVNPGSVPISLLFLDINGDGTVDILDYNLARKLNGTRLP